MKTVEITLYKFDELSTEAQEKAISENWDINVDYDWWQFTYEDADEIGLIIKGFDIDRGGYVKGEFKNGSLDTALKIKENHGEPCKTYKTATNFLTDYDKLVEKYSDGVNTNIVAEDNEYDFDQDADDLEKQFLYDLCEDYRNILSNEYDFLTSKEGIKESLISNDYDFTEDGKKY